MKTNGKIVALSLLCGAIAFAFASSLYLYKHFTNSSKFEVDGIYYKVETENRVAITYRGNSYDAYADEYEGVVIIPENVIYKGINYTVEYIDDFAFKNCGKMTSIALPPSVQLVGIGAFYGCESLKEIHISDLSAWCKLSFWSVTDDVGESPFWYADSLYLNGELITELVVPEDVEEIGSHIFEAYETLKSVILHDGIKSIHKSAFLYCSNLTEITFSDSIEYIGPYAFKGTAWYENQPDGEIYIGNHLYEYKGEMPSNTSVVVKEGTEYICQSAFDCCKGLTRITIPSSIRCIHNYAFCGCNNLKEIYCKGQTPPYLNNFYSEYHKDVVLYVPKGAKEIYKNGGNMGYFENIKEIDFDN